MNSDIKSIFAILSKELKSEFRTRYSTNTVILFILVCISLIVFATSGITLKEPLQAAFIWIIIFFTAMTSLSRVFIYEEERGTIDFLKLNAKSTNIFLGKLLFNSILAISTSIIITLFFVIMVGDFIMRTPLIYITTLLFGSLAIASSTTILSAIITKAATKNSLLPILSFPILLPIILIAIDNTRLSLEGWEFSESVSNLSMLISYTGIVTVASFLLFNFIWED
ncbi:MAG: heme exporter protein CcmB [Candidatus Kapaibacteriota bacterium]|jgi:heme exporter protein B